MRHLDLFPAILLTLIGILIMYIWPDFYSYTHWIGIGLMIGGVLESAEALTD